MGMKSPPDLLNAYRCCCVHVRTASVVLALFYMACSVLVLITESVTVAKGKDSCEGLCDGYYRIADATSVFLLIILLFLVSVMMLYGVLKYRERLLIPFLVLQILDLCLRVLNLFNFYVDLSAYSSYKTNTNQLMDVQEKPQINSQEMYYLLSSTLFSITLLFIKAYMINCVWKCYKYIQAHNESCTIGVCTVYNLSEKTVLPTYDEVLQLPLKEAPPPYMPV
ncbi:lysosomal-associated transmembrane protein 5 [Latimeria chalumnae]|uniref:lysosomal-associated transmembrane protein 5 n=1 Tax=Latimeria chalumnae TaxID=7897 RepID=UPI0006D8ED7C|nr:PREDICTED: lysosomal-associated transmembrane protein 5 [Latimeria chalumnae]|eukprot:XP_005993197.2 PREDICTED: lysosomal-associated transmembrane protein 5 [Latimeria chalumnae]